MKAMFTAFLLFVLLSPAVHAQSALEKEIISLMTGSFNSEQQSKEDTSYYNITLHMVPIWTDREGNWLYVEQTLTSTPEKPYRQRVYHVVEQKDGTIASSVYRIENQDAAIGKWQSPEYFDGLKKDILVERKGCTVYMTKMADGSFIGSTRERECESSMGGATYATSRVEMTKEGIMSWDQGFDNEAAQVWGAEKGGYVFLRID